MYLLGDKMPLFSLQYYIWLFYPTIEVQKSKFVLRFWVIGKKGRFALSGITGEFGWASKTYNGQHSTQVSTYAKLW